MLTCIRCINLRKRHLKTCVCYRYIHEKSVFSIFSWTRWSSRKGINFPNYIGLPHSFCLHTWNLFNMFKTFCYINRKNLIFLLRIIKMISVFLSVLDYWKLRATYLYKKCKSGHFNVAVDLSYNILVFHYNISCSFNQSDSWDDALQWLKRYFFRLKAQFFLIPLNSAKKLPITP